MTVWMAAWFLGTALAEDADVIAARNVSVPAEAVYTLIADLGNHGRFMDAACTADWSAVAPNAAGKPAVAVTYDLGLLHPRLSMVVDRAEAPRWIDFDHEGKRGFITRFKVEPVTADTARVSIHTFVDPPGFPLRRYYFTRVRPKWTACYVASLDRLATIALEAGAATP